MCVCKGGCIFVLSTVNLCGIFMCHELTPYNAWGICTLWGSFVCFHVSLSGRQSLGTIRRNYKVRLDDCHGTGR